MRSGEPLPKRIQEAPELMPGLEFYLEAFEELSTCRQITGMGGLGLVPWTAMRDYADEFDLEGEDREDLFELVRAMDLEYVRHMNKKGSKGDG